MRATAGLALVVPLAACTASGGIACEAGPGWRTVTVAPEPDRAARVRLELPVEWRRVDTSACEWQVTAYGPPGTDACDVAGYPVTLHEADVFDSARQAGLITSADGRWSGHVVAGGTVVAVGGTDRATTRRVLASARRAADPDPEVARWRGRDTVDGASGVTAVLPHDPRAAVEVHPGRPDCAVERTAVRREPGRGWSAGLCRDRVVTVTAPTPALVQVVRETVRGW